MLCRKRAEQFFFDCLFDDEDENLNRLFLAHSIGSRDTLFQHRWVPGGSTLITVFAAWRFRPVEPAFVVRNKRQPGLL